MNWKHRSVAAAVFLSSNTLLVHQRSAKKDLYPLYWDIFVQGALPSGVEPEIQMRRELWEEMGIEGSKLLPLGEQYFENRNNRAFYSVYGTFAHFPSLKFQDGEVVAAREMHVFEIEAFFQEYRVVPDSKFLWRWLLKLGGDEDDSSVPFLRGEES